MFELFIKKIRAEHKCCGFSNYQPQLKEFIQPPSPPASFPPGGTECGDAKMQVGNCAKIINVALRRYARRLTKRSAARSKIRRYSARRRRHITPDIIIIKQEITSCDKCAGSDAVS